MNSHFENFSEAENQLMLMMWVVCRIIWYHVYKCWTNLNVSERFLNRSFSQVIISNFSKIMNENQDTIKNIKNHCCLDFFRLLTEIISLINNNNEFLKQTFSSVLVQHYWKWGFFESKSHLHGPGLFLLKENSIT